MASGSCVPAKEHSGVRGLAGSVHALPPGLCSQCTKLCHAHLCQRPAVRYKEKSPVPSRRKKSSISAGCLGFKELSSLHKELLSSYSTSNTIIYRSGMYDRGTKGPHHGPKPHCAKHCTNTEQRDDPFPKELTRKHKMEKSYY